jgi:excinuclease ABC subunit C
MAMRRPDPSAIPPGPGVYLYRDGEGTVVYVGKARRLRRRVLSYFRAEGLAPKTRALMARAESVEFLATTTEKEAFLLEASLIKKHRPRYNILLRDDKQYALFRINLKAPYPRIEIVRRAGKDGARYFGPFTSALAARETWKLLHRAFPLRRCADKAMKNRVRPCLYHHMGQCLAPCTGKVGEEEYLRQAEGAVRVLEGKSDALLRELEAAMLEASDRLEFERAAALRDQMRAVRQTVERQAAVLPGGGDMDVVGLSPSDKGLALAVVFVRQGAVQGGRTYFWPGLAFEEASELLWSFLGQFYAQFMPPGRILLPWMPLDAEEEEAEDPEDAEQLAGTLSGVREERPAEAGGLAREAMEQTLAERRGGPVRIVAPQNAQDNKLVDIAAANAREEARLKERGGPDGVLARIGAALGLAGPPSRIECVDVSHTGGSATRVGLVVWVDGLHQPEASRAYALEGTGGDDYKALYAWAGRRIESGPPWPDLLLVDGGRGQIAAVARGLAEHAEQAEQGHAPNFPLAGIAKARDEQGHADRRAGNVADRIFLPGRSDAVAALREGSPELLLLQNVRDSAHRFAISRHRRARGKAALQGELTRLPGIGPATARLLWDAFGSIEAMRRASLAELEALPGIGPAKAKGLHGRLHGGEPEAAFREARQTSPRQNSGQGVGQEAGQEAGQGAGRPAGRKQCLAEDAQEARAAASKEASRVARTAGVPADRSCAESAAGPDMAPDAESGSRSDTRSHAKSDAGSAADQVAGGQP